MRCAVCFISFASYLNTYLIKNTRNHVSLDLKSFPRVRALFIKIEAKIGPQLYQGPAKYVLKN